MPTPDLTVTLKDLKKSKSNGQLILSSEIKKSIRLLFSSFRHHFHAKLRKNKRHYSLNPSLLSQVPPMAAAASINIVAVPYPGRGHINPMLTLCGLLLPSAAVTVVVTEEWLSLLGGAAAAPPGVRFRTVPNVIPSENGRADNFIGFLEAVSTKLEAPFEQLLDALDAPATAIIADTFLPWAVDVGKRRGIPVCSVFTMSATSLYELLGFDRLPGAGNREERVTLVVDSDPEQDDELVAKYIPGHSCIRLFYFGSFQAQGKAANLALAAISQAREAQCLILATAYELEPRIIDTLLSELKFPVYSIGPVIPYSNLQETKPPSSLNGEDYLSWLNLQPENSVLYVSLGSFLSVSRSQMDEIALGLQASNIKFLWVARGDSSWLQETVDSSDRGMVVPWCEQLKVLCHPSVGGFLTHCGWNSTMEALFAGVPMLTFPITADQPVNARLVVDEWRVGLVLRGDVRSKEVVGREKVTEMVNRVMDMDGAESREMRQRSAVLRKVCRNAIEDGGSSAVSLRALAETFLQ